MKLIANIKIGIFFAIWGISLVQAAETDHISAPEGLYAYPKSIFEFTVNASDVRNCFLRNLITVLDNGTRLHIERKYFGLEPIQTTSSEAEQKYKSLGKRSTNVETPSASATHDFIPTSSSSTGENTSHNGTGQNDSRRTSTNSTTTSISNDTVPRTNPSTCPNASHTGQQGRRFKLVQLHDLDREQYDNFAVTVLCKSNKSEKSTDWSKVILINVTDINDHTPVFNKSSLHSSVNIELVQTPQFVRPVLTLSATDKDIGINAELRYRKIPGTSRVVLPDGTRIASASLLILVNSSGPIYMWYPFLAPDSKVTFSVSVKDCGDMSYGNRATASATVSFYGSSNQSFTTSSSLIETSVAGSGLRFEWWMVCTPLLAVALLVAVVFVVTRVMLRKKQRRSVLVIDDEFLLAGSQESDFPS